jgi:gliding motility-associated-like protein
MKFNNIAKIPITRLLISVSVAFFISGICQAQISVTPTATPAEICTGGSILLNANVSGGTGPFTYDWTSNPAGFSSTSPNPTDSPSVTTTYFVTVTDQSDLSTASGQIVVKVDPLLPVSISIAASENPVCSGTNVTFTATPVNGGAAPDYQWKVNGSNRGTNSSTFSYVPADNDNVICILTSNALCPSGSPATSNTVTMTVNPSQSVSVSIAASSNPVCAGTSVTFTATPTNGGTAPAYQWKVNGTNSGTNSSTFSYTPSNHDAVTCVLTSNVMCPTNNPATSNTVTMTVDPVVGVSVSVSASPSGPICAGTSVTFTATPVNGGSSPLYQWKVNGTNAGTNSSTFSYTPANNDAVTVELTSNATCTSGNPATSAPVTIVVTSPLAVSVSIAASPSGSICAGTSVTFTATPVNGGTPSYQWKVNGSDVGTNSPTFTSATLVNNDAVTVTMTSSLTCVISGTANSNSITMTVNPLPVPTLSSSAAGNSFCAGTSVTFTASGGTNYDFMVGATTVQNGISNIYTTSTLTNGQIVSVIVSNSDGCSATSSGITNTVHPLPTASIISSAPNNTSCQGASVTFTASGGISYDFRVSGSTVQNGASNTYTTSSLANDQVVDVVVTNSNGCSATSAGITNIVSPIPIPTLTSSDADNIFCAGTSVTFTASGGSSFNFRIGGASVQNGPATTYTTSSLINGQIVDVVVSNAGGCSATSAGITNTVNPQPVANAGTGGSVCGLNFKFNAVPSTGIGTWTKTTGPGTASFAPNSNTATATVTVSEYGTYTFNWTEANGQCTSTSAVTVNFYLPPIANAGTGGNNCGLAFNLNGTMNAGTGTWAKVSGPGNVIFNPNPASPNALVTVTAFGTYTFSWTVTNGTCSNSANVNVVFMQELSANGGPGGSTCGKVFKLNAMVPANGIGTWSKSTGPGTAVFTTDTHLAGATVTVDQFGNYAFAWTVVTGTCSSSDIIRVIFHDNPPLSAGRDTAVCKGGSVQLKAVGVGSVSWTPVQLLSNPVIINPIATPDTTTKFVVHLVDQFGCKNSDSVMVEVRDKIIADAGPDQELNDVNSTQLDAKLAHSYEKGIWSIVSGTGHFADSTNATTVISGLSLGINKLLWTVTNGYCAPASDSANIIIKNLVIPTLITPNMDGRNDYFIIGGITNEANTELIIFDRRGVQVYKNYNYDNSWNGVDYNNNQLPDDTYFYILKFANGKSYKGYIVIRR